MNVARSEEEAKLQASGVDVTGDRVEAQPEVGDLFEQVPEERELGTEQEPREESGVEGHVED